MTITLKRPYMYTTKRVSFNSINMCKISVMYEFTEM